MQDAASVTHYLVEGTAVRSVGQGASQILDGAGSVSKRATDDGCVRVVLHGTGVSR